MLCIQAIDLSRQLGSFQTRIRQLDGGPVKDSDKDVAN